MRQTRVRERQRQAEARERSGARTTRYGAELTANPNPSLGRDGAHARLPKRSVEVLYPRRAANGSLGSSGSRRFRLGSNPLRRTRLGDGLVPNSCGAAAVRLCRRLAGDAWLGLVGLLAGVGLVGADAACRAGLGAPLLAVAVARLMLTGCGRRGLARCSGDCFHSTDRFDHGRTRSRMPRRTRERVC